MLQSAVVPDSRFSGLSSLLEEPNVDEYVPTHNETHRLAINALVKGGRETYQDFLRVEGVDAFLSEEEIAHILDSITWPPKDNELKDNHQTEDGAPSTYFPVASDEEVPDLDLGWPEFMFQNVETRINMFFNPPRTNTPSIKDVIRRQIQEAKLAIAIAMDVFTDVEIFRDIVAASFRGVMIYILLDDFQFSSFLTMTEKANIPVQALKNMRVRTVKGQDYRCQSGAKFHGTMDQRFMLVDCHTVTYGSYSFMWSYERINLSMVVVITGQLVVLFDEEFRRLYARSTLPKTTAQESMIQKNLRPTNSYVHLYNPHSTELLGRRYSLDAFKTEAYGMTSSFHGARSAKRPTAQRGLSLQSLLSQSYQMDNGRLTKIHTYEDGLQKKLNGSNYLGSRSSIEYGIVEGANHLPSPSDVFANCRHLSTSDWSLFKLRIDSYLKDSQTPTKNDQQHIHPALSDGKSSLSRSSSFNFQDFEQGQHIPTNYTNSPTSALSLESQTCLSDNRSDIRTLLPSGLCEGQREKEDLTLKLRNSKGSHGANLPVTSNLGKRPLQSVYTSLLHARQTPTKTDPENRCEEVESPQNTQQNTSDDVHSSKTSLSKKNSNDDSVLTEDLRESPNNLKESHRSVSHFDLHTPSKRNNLNYHNWQEPPSRTSSATHLESKLSEPLFRSSNLRRMCPFESSNRTMMSLLDIPEEAGVQTPIASSENLDLRAESCKETTAQGCTDLSQISSGSVSPHHIEVNAQIVERGKEIIDTTDKPSDHEAETEEDMPEIVTESNAVLSTRTSEDESKIALNTHVESSPCVATDAAQNVRYDSVSSIVTLESLSSNSLTGRKKKAYSRFEQFVSFEKKSSDKPVTIHVNTHIPEKRPSLFVFHPRGVSSGMSQSYSRFQTQTSNENKFGRFIQRVGNLIHKNK